MPKIRANAFFENKSQTTFIFKGLGRFFDDNLQMPGRVR